MTPALTPGVIPARNNNPDTIPMKIRSTLLASVAALSAVLATARADETKIGQIMKDGFKGDTSLVKKVTKGTASADEIKKLVEYCESLEKETPKKGDAASWKEKTGALTKAVKDVQSGAEGAAKALENAVNCKACHDVHKGGGKKPGPGGPGGDQPKKP